LSNELGVSARKLYCLNWSYVIDL